MQSIVFWSPIRSNISCNCFALFTPFEALAILQVIHHVVVTDGWMCWWEFGQTHIDKPPKLPSTLFRWSFNSYPLSSQIDSHKKCKKFKFSPIFLTVLWARHLFCCQMHHVLSILAQMIVNHVYEACQCMMIRNSSVLYNIRTHNITFWPIGI